MYCGALQSLITISGASNPTTKLWAATTLRQLSWHPRLLPKLVSEGVVPALVHLVMTSQGKCQQECAEALCHLSCCPEVLFSRGVFLHFAAFDC
jgi:hypothetical protein